MKTALPTVSSDSTGVITYAYLRIEVVSKVTASTAFLVITHAYLRIEVQLSALQETELQVITYAYLQIEDFALLCVFSATKL